MKDDLPLDDVDELIASIVRDEVRRLTDSDRGRAVRASSTTAQADRS